MSYVLGSTHSDRHTAYVALSRHRDNATLFYARDDFGGKSPNATPEKVRDRFMETLSRARPQELAHDYLDSSAMPTEPVATDKHADNSLAAIQAQAHEAWAAARAKDLDAHASPEDVRRLGRERWKEYRKELDADRGAGQDESNTADQHRGHSRDDDHSM
ncbi:MAG TPA: hypothetical protein VGI90_16490 [Steroidobacteraceae bacterium]